MPECLPVSAHPVQFKCTSLHWLA